jgi:IS5 family transposase
MATFFSLDAARRIGNDNQLMKMSKLINWGRIDYKVRRINKNLGDGKTGGVVPYDALSMFKAVLLQNWGCLSDAGLEDALNVRIDFMLFCGFDISDDIPDESTICRFRNKLIEKNLLEKLLNEINSQLADLGLKVQKANMAVLDATLIESNSRPKNKILEEEMPEDRNENDFNNKDNNDSNTNFKEIKSSDPNATWLKKGKKSIFGYKAFATVDDEGFIDKTMTVPANESEINKLEEMIIDCHEFGGDKGYDSRGNRKALRAKGIKTRIMYKKSKGKPMNIWQKRFNKAVSKRRFRVEQTFGTLKRRFKFTKASYFTTKKVQAQFTLKAICLNLLKAVNKVQLILPEKQLLTG